MHCVPIRALRTCYVASASRHKLMRPHLNSLPAWANMLTQACVPSVETLMRRVVLFNFDGYGVVAGGAGGPFIGRALGDLRAPRAVGGADLKRMLPFRRIHPDVFPESPNL